MTFFLPNNSHLKVQCLKYAHTHFRAPKYAHTHFRALFNAPVALRKLWRLYCVKKVNFHSCQCNLRSTSWTLLWDSINTSHHLTYFKLTIYYYQGADKSLARPGRKQASKHVRDARDFNDIEMRAVLKFFFLQGKAPKEIHAILTQTLACFLPGRAKDLSAPL